MKSKPSLILASARVKVFHRISIKHNVKLHHNKIMGCFLLILQQLLLMDVSLPQTSVNTRKLWEVQITTITMLQDAWVRCQF